MNDLDLAEEVGRCGYYVDPDGTTHRIIPAKVAEQIIAALRRGPEPSVPEGEQLWLIERTYAKGQPAEQREFWLGGTTGDLQIDSFYSGGHPVWTTDALKAARFPSRAIAETLRYRHFHPESTAEVCGHMFQCGISPERPPSGEMGCEEYHDGIIGVFKTNPDGSRNLKVLTPQASEQFRAMLQAAEASKEAK